MSEASHGHNTAENDRPATFESIRGLEWENHDFDETSRVLQRDHAITSAQDVGERVAAMINSKSKPDLVAIAAGLENDVGIGLLEHLECAEKSLEFRLSLVQCALARLTVAAAVITEEKD